MMNECIHAESHFLPGFQLSLRHHCLRVGAGQVNGSFEFDFAGGFFIPKLLKADFWLTLGVKPSGCSVNVGLATALPLLSEFTYLGDCPGLWITQLQCLFRTQLSVGKRKGYTQGLFSGALSEWLSHCPSQPFQPLLSHRLYSSLKEVQYFPAVPWGMKDREQRTRILPRNQGLGIFCDTLILPSFLCHSLSSIKIILCVLTGHLLFHFNDSSRSVPFLFIHLSLKKILRRLCSSHTHTNTHTKWSYFCALWRGKKNPLKSSVYSLLLVLHILWVLTKCTVIIYPPSLKYHRE